MNLKSLFIPALLMMLLVHFMAHGQETEAPDLVSAALLENSSMTITGSSTLHDWEVEAAEFSVEFRIPETWFESVDNWSGEEIAALHVTVPVEHLDGGRNKMNRDLREALRFEEYPDIRFTLDKFTFTVPSDTGRTGKVSGRVMIAGEEREIQFNANLGINEWSQIVATGRVPMNMRDYNIEPPTALFGVIKADEEINLAFELYFGREN